MKMVMISVAIAITTILAAQRESVAQACPLGVIPQSALPCYRLMKDARGNQVWVKWTGLYQDCLAQGPQMGFNPDQVARFCDERRAKGWLR